MKYSKYIPILLPKEAYVIILPNKITIKNYICYFAINPCKVQHHLWQWDVFSSAADVKRAIIERRKRS
jgi:hypothetical protein